ncbi:hypothetical protein CRG98_026574 [Punica granatum]|uniref:Uncharacterized protein n=1 Tax=Punica granatum TaxID=22663 RepID=A0A2I0J9S1_PUNGR|nr:hypothetical protein CRG98_026574 [Punica granatum]
MTIKQQKLDIARKVKGGYRALKEERTRERRWRHKRREEAVFRAWTANAPPAPTSRTPKPKNWWWGGIELAADPIPIMQTVRRAQ